MNLALERLNAECAFDLARICFKVVLSDPSPSSLCLVSHFASLSALLLILDLRNPGV